MEQLFRWHKESSSMRKIFGKSMKYFSPESCEGKRTKRSRSFLLASLFCLTGLLSVAQEPCPFSGKIWKGTLRLNDSINLDFYFKLESTAVTPYIDIYNAEEAIRVDEVTITKDSLNFRMPVFDSEFRCKRVSRSGRNELEGKWINHSRKNKNIIPFAAKEAMIKPASVCSGCKSFTGKWEVDFSPGDTIDHYKAMGLFRNAGCWDFIYGTFLTETGDYRYLAGSVDFNEKDSLMMLSCFDGSHAFYFKAIKNEDGTISGDFYSGSHHHEKWIAKRNEEFELHDPDSLTALKTGHEKVDFSFPNLEGNTVSLSDEKYRNKVVIVQLMGSWCPNCMDETAWLAELHKKYKSQGLEVIALAYERTEDPVKAAANVKRLQQRFGATYEFLITGKTGKEAAARTLPMLTDVKAFPTTIFIDKKGTVRKIHTGFSGPGTGEHYKKFTEETQSFINGLLKE